MPSCIVKVSNRFEKSYFKLPKEVKELAKKKEFIFRDNPFDPQLDTHKLHGKDKDSWSFSITGKYRIKFIFVSERAVLFLEVGTHDIYQ